MRLQITFLWTPLPLQICLANYYDLVEWGQNEKNNTPDISPSKCVVGHKLPQFFPHLDSHRWFEWNKSFSPRGEVCDPHFGDSPQRPSVAALTRLNHGRWALPRKLSVSRDSRVFTCTCIGTQGEFQVHGGPNLAPLYLCWCLSIYYCNPCGSDHVINIVLCVSA